MGISTSGVAQPRPRCPAPRINGKPVFREPILNSPYDYPARHWEFDSTGQPTQKIIGSRRRAEFITPIPKPKKQKGAAKQAALLFDEGKGLSTAAQQYDHTAIINAVRQEVDTWRRLPSPNDWEICQCAFQTIFLASGEWFSGNAEHHFVGTNKMPAVGACHIRPICLDPKR